MSTKEGRKFSWWCKIQCKPGQGCKHRRKAIEWHELKKLCPKLKKQK